MAGRDVRFGIFADDRASRTLAHVGAAAQKSVTAAEKKLEATKRRRGLS